MHSRATCKSCFDATRIKPPAIHLNCSWYCLKIKLISQWLNSQHAKNRLIKQLILLYPVFEYVTKQSWKQAQVIISWHQIKDKLKQISQNRIDTLRWLYFSSNKSSIFSFNFLIAHESYKIGWLKPFRYKLCDCIQSLNLTTRNGKYIFFDIFEQLAKWYFCWESKQILTFSKITLFEPQLNINEISFVYINMWCVSFHTVFWSALKVSQQHFELSKLVFSQKYFCFRWTFSTLLSSLPLQVISLK